MCSDVCNSWFISINISHISAIYQSKVAWIYNRKQIKQYILILSSCRLGDGGMLWCLPFKTHLSCLNRRSQIMFDILVLPFSLGHNALELAAKLKPILIDEIECRTQLLNQGWYKGYTCLHCTAHLSYLQKKPYGFFHSFSQFYKVAEIL